MNNSSSRGIDFAADYFRSRLDPCSATQGSGLYSLYLARRVGLSGPACRFGVPDADDILAVDVFRGRQGLVLALGNFRSALRQGFGKAVVGAIAAPASWRAIARVFAAARAPAGIDRAAPGAGRAIAGVAGLARKAVIGMAGVIDGTAADMRGGRREGNCRFVRVFEGDDPVGLRHGRFLRQRD